MNLFVERCRSEESVGVVGVVVSVEVVPGTRRALLLLVLAVTSDGPGVAHTRVATAPVLKVLFFLSLALLISLTCLLSVLEGDDPL